MVHLIVSFLRVILPDSGPRRSAKRPQKGRRISLGSRVTCVTYPASQYSKTRTVSPSSTLYLLADVNVIPLPLTCSFLSQISFSTHHPLEIKEMHLRLDVIRLVLPHATDYVLDLRALCIENVSIRAE